MCRTKFSAEGSKEDIEELRGWVKKGKAWAMEMLACKYRDGIGVKQSNKNTIELYEMAATRGNASAQHNLGQMYHHGIFGLTKSSKKAIELYEMAAKGGNAGAQFNLGQYYHQGRHGLTQSSKRAIEYYTLAAEQGDVHAQTNVGLMYARGGQNSKAREWWTKAAAQGQDNAIEELKYLEEHGL